MKKVRIGESRAGIAIFGAGNAGAIERGEAFADRVALGPLFDDLHHRSPVRAARRYSHKTRVIGELALPRHLAKRGEIAGRNGRYQDIAVARPDRTISVTRRRNRKLRLLQFVDQQVQHAIHQRDVDTLAFTGASALDQRGLDRGVAKDPAQHVGDEDSPRSRPIPVPGIAHQRTIKTALGVNDHGVGRALGGRAGLSVAGDRAINQARIDLAQRLITEAQAIHHAGAKILHDNIRFLDQPMNKLDRISGFQVKRKTALSRVELTEISAVPVAERRAQPHVIAFRRLDLDDVGTDVGKQPCAIRARQHDRKIEHAHAVERRRLGLRLLHPLTPWIYRALHRTGSRFSPPKKEVSVQAGLPASSM